MEGLDLIPRGGPPDDIGLVGDDDKQKAGAMQTVQGIRYAWENLEVVQRKRRLRLAGSEDLPVDHAVAVQKDCALHVVDSHLASKALTIG